MKGKQNVSAVFVILLLICASLFIGGGIYFEQ